MNRFTRIRKTLGSWFSMPWYPIAISAYPALALLAKNMGQVWPDAALRPLLVSVAFGLLMFFAAWLFFRRTYTAAFLTMLLLILFFTYGHVYLYIDERFPDSPYTIWLAIEWGVLFVIAILWVKRPKLSFESVALSVNISALALLLMSGCQIMAKSEVKPRSVHALGSKNAPVETDLVRPENPPDVYFFLLDSYGRADLLKSAYGFDNSDFIEDLEKRAFYVAKCSQSNYVRTDLSLGSSLNMQYLQALSDTFTPDNESHALLWKLLKHSAVRYNFESIGYETVNFASGFAWLELSDEDHFMSPPPISSGMTDFEGLFLRTTLARYAQDYGWVDPDYFLGVDFRNRFRYIFNSMDDIAKISQPTFSYIHVISPHPPFVFDPEGNPTYPPDFWNDQRMYPPDMYERGYINQLPYLNKNVLQAIDTILADSKTPPIIILQGDHGPWLQPTNKRFWNLTAMYFPGHEDQLYSSITPVNIFRLVFNSYFGGKYDMLPDQSYFSPPDLPYDFSKVPNECK